MSEKQGKLSVRSTSSKKKNTSYSSHFEPRPDLPPRKLSRSRPDPRRAIDALGLRSIAVLDHFAPYRSARLIVATTRHGISLPNLNDYVIDAYADHPRDESPSWPVSALKGINPEQATNLADLGIHTIADLANLSQYAAEIITSGSDLARPDNGFIESPSAPAELLPAITGAITTTKRLSSFVKSADLRDLRFGVNKVCIEPLPIAQKTSQLIEALLDLLDDANLHSGVQKQIEDFLRQKSDETKPYYLSELFTELKCPVVYLGYILSHEQDWINLGTFLGDVKHSVCLAPGEIRQIAFLDWQRRQALERSEDTSTEEWLQHEAVHNRALEEIVQSVAIEHQMGGTETEANTSVLALSAVGSGALAGGLAGGGAGALLGAGIGTMVEPGGGTLLGAVGGGLLGGAIGLAGGAVYSSTQLLGTIHASSEGDRDIGAELNQRITQSTQQNSGLKQSLFSTVVLDDVQAEQVNATTRNISNYNHMHTLNIVYYDVLQHYLVRTRITRAEPIIYLPYRFLDFTGFRYIRDYWDIIRLHLDEDLRRHGDTFFSDEDGPTTPDTKPVPPVPTPPLTQEPPSLDGLIIDIFYDARLQGVNVGVELGMGISKKAGTDEITGTEMVEASAADGEGYTRYARYMFPNISNANEISHVSVKRTQVQPSDFKFKLRVVSGTIRTSNGILQNLNGHLIITGATIGADKGNGSFSYSWTPASGYDQGIAATQAEYEVAAAQRNNIIAENEIAHQTFEIQVRDKERIKLRLEKAVLRRRHLFTQIVLSSIEPEQLKELLDSLEIYAQGEADKRIPLHLIAHTHPIAMTPGALVLKFKRYSPKHEQQLAAWIGDGKETTKISLNSNLVELLIHNRDVHEMEQTYQDVSADSTANIFLPTGGLFAEAILGVANGAEYHDIERRTNWHETPIPHQPPAISPLDLASRHQQQDIGVTLPEGQLNLVNAPNFPDPTGMAAILTAIQNGAMFRDMSKSAELAGILGNMMDLTGKMGQAAASMTGEAQTTAMQTAGQMGQAAAALVSDMFSQTMQQAGAQFKSLGQKGATIKAIKDNLPPGPERNQAIKDALELPQIHHHPPVTGGATGGNGSGDQSASADSEKIISPPLTTDLPTLPPPNKVPFGEPGQSAGSKEAIRRLKNKLLSPGSYTEEEIAQIGEQWFEGSVLPGLKQASSDDRLLIQALNEYADWKSHLAVFDIEVKSFAGPPDLAAANADAEKWAIGGLQNAVLEAQIRAIQTNNINYLTDAINWSVIAEWLALESVDNRLDANAVVEDFPFTISLDHIRYPSVVAVGDSFTLSAVAGLKFGDNDPVYKEPVYWQIMVAGGTVTGLTNGKTNSSGGFSTAITRAQEPDFEVRITVTYPVGQHAFRTVEKSLTPSLP